jgi:dinuclear metal center YbgI/SA1388 family protein
MPQLDDITAFLRKFAPPSLAEKWDNVGLLLGDEQRDVQRVLTCLTLSPDVAREAVTERADLVVTHHPILFKPVQQITAGDAAGRMLLELLAARVAVYSPHTGYDSAEQGINQQLAEMFELREIVPLTDEPDGLGTGRCGSLPAEITLGDFIDTVKPRLRVPRLQHVGDPTSRVRRVGVACGAGGEFVSDAIRRDCQVLLTGEARFHSCLEARENGLALVLPGHYATERPAMERLAEVLAGQFTDLTVWPSRVESDPVLFG